MDTKLYLTIAAVVAILYALAFLVIPVQASLFFSDFAEPRAILYLRFCGAAILAWGLIVWLELRQADRKDQLNLYNLAMVQPNQTAEHVKDQALAIHLPGRTRRR